MSVNNTVIRSIEAAKSELESTIGIKLDESKANHVKTFDYFYMKMSAIILNKPYLSYEQPSSVSLSGTVCAEHIHIIKTST